jgi:glycerophosphoryl diester phosphodiesterase
MTSILKTYAIPLFIGLTSLFSAVNALAKPIVIAHRGAPAYLPEHTLESTTLAHALTPDYIEQDLVLSKDGVPVVLHDIHLETVTDVEQKFPARKRKDNRWYAIDFTLAELRTLRVHERANSDGSQVFPNRYQGMGNFAISTFAEHITLIQNLNRSFNKNIGFYPEIKAPAFHRTEGQDISRIVLNVIREHGLDSADAKIYVQCFDFNETKRLRNELGAKVKLVQLLAENSWEESPTDYDKLKTQSGIREIASVAQGIGPWIPQLVTLEESALSFSQLATYAKENKLVIHPYTHRVDQLPTGITSDQLLSILFDQVGVDGIFSDFPDKAKAFIEQHHSATTNQP